MTGTLPAGLREFYENPAVPVASGVERSRRQAVMLARVLPPEPSSSSTSAAATAPRRPPPARSWAITGLSVSTGPRTRCAGPQPG